MTDSTRGVNEKRVDALLGEAMPMFRKHKTFAELREGLLARLDFDARRSEF